MSVKELHRTDYRYANSGLFATLQGTKILETLIDQSVDNKIFIPIKREIFQINALNTDFIGGGQRNPTIFLNQSKGFKINQVFLHFLLPAQYARNSFDKMCYDSLPGINCISSIKTCIKNSVTEHISAPEIIKRYLDYFGYDTFMQLADEWWGGVRTDKICSPNQKLHGILNNEFDPVDISKNVILPELKIKLPIPVSFFFNEEKHCFLLASNSIVEVMISFKTSQEIITKTRDCLLVPLTGSMSVVAECLNPVEIGNYYNNLAYINLKQNDEYYFKDTYFETTIKKIACNSDFKFPIHNDITKEIDMYAYNPQFCCNGSKEFFGDTCNQAERNWIAAMFFPFSTNKSLDSTINLKTGLFLNNTNKYGTQLTIHYHDTKDNKMILRWIKNSTAYYDLEITCDKCWEDLGDFYFDICTFPNSLPSAQAVSPGLFQLKNFNLKIKDYVQTTNLDCYPDLKCSFQTSHLVANGYFTFCFDQSTQTNKYVFMDVNNVEKRIDKKTWSYLISQNVPAAHNGFDLVCKKFPQVNRNNFQYFDLDCVNRINLCDVSFESGCRNDPVLNIFLPYKGNYSKIKNFFDSQINLNFAYKDTSGYEDFSNSEVTGFSFKPVSEPLFCDETNISDIIKDKAQSQLSFLIIQTCLRTLKYTSDYIIEHVNDEDRKHVNTQIVTKMLIPQKYHKAVRDVDQENNSSQNTASNLNASIQEDKLISQSVFKRAPVNHSIISGFKRQKNNEIEFDLNRQNYHR